MMSLDLGKLARSEMILLAGMGLGLTKTTTNLRMRLRLVSSNLRARGSRPKANTIRNSSNAVDYFCVKPILAICCCDSGRAILYPSHTC